MRPEINVENENKEGESNVTRTLKTSKKGTVFLCVWINVVLWCVMMSGWMEKGENFEENNEVLKFLEVLRGFSNN